MEAILLHWPRSVALLQHAYPMSVLTAVNGNLRCQLDSCYLLVLTPTYAETQQLLHGYVGAQSLIIDRRTKRIAAAQPQADERLCKRLDRAAFKCLQPHLRKPPREAELVRHLQSVLRAWHALHSADEAVCQSWRRGRASIGAIYVRGGWQIRLQAGTLSHRIAAYADRTTLDGAPATLDDCKRIVGTLMQ